MSLVTYICRSVSNECVIKEELLDIVQLKDRTRGIDVVETMMAAFVKANYSKSVWAEVCMCVYMWCGSLQ